MSKRTETNDRVQVARVLTEGKLQVRVNRQGLFVGANNGLAIVAAVLIVALVVVLV